MNAMELTDRLSREISALLAEECQFDAMGKSYIVTASPRLGGGNPWVEVKVKFPNWFSSTAVPECFIKLGFELREALDLEAKGVWADVLKLRLFHSLRELYDLKPKSPALSGVAA